MLTARTALLAGAVLLLAAAGCKSKSAPTPENFTTALNAYFLDHPDCLLPEAPHFPLETSDPTQLKQMNALVAAQLLTVEEERDIHVSRFTTTPAGARHAPRFCFGHRVVTSIDSFTPPAAANGFIESQVTYHYRMEDVPIWADSNGVRTAFPAFAHATTGTASDTITMASVPTGWQVPS